jgi:GNAT superfamily N-acetyltransferase
MSAGVQIAPHAGLEIRRAAPGDRDILVAFYTGFEPRPASLGLPPAHDLETWIARLAPQPNFLALVDGRLAGHCILYPEDGTAEVAVFIHQDFRGQGLGRKLLLEAIGEARRRGLDRIWGVCELDNFPMLRLAYALGFVKGEDPYEFHLDLGDAEPPAGTREKPASH